MLIKLKWNNSNDLTAAVQVFRATAVIDTANPGVPIATLPGNATSYDDAAVVAGTTYYYAVAVSKGAKRIFTPVKTFVNEANPGPGCAPHMFGDERLGYMGKLAPTDFIDVVKYLGLPALTANVFRVSWHKFIRKGKILYIAEMPLNYDSGYRGPWSQNLRKSVGLVSGIQWGFDNSAQADAAKTSIANFGGSTFHFRALRGLPDNWDGTAPTAGLIADPTTEFNELIPPLLANEFYFPNKIGCVRQGTLLRISSGNIACAEKFGTKQLVRMMQPQANTNAAFWNYAATLDRSKASFLAYLLRDDATGEPAYDARTWDAIWPVFELIA
jgi:hypothetical protein